MELFKELWLRLKATLKDYFKGLIILSALNFVILTIGLKLIGINLWALKAFLLSIVDILPVLGSGAVMIPWAIIKALSGSIDTGAQLAILYVITAIVKFIAEPLIIGKKVGVSPLLTLGITVISTMIFGPLGAIFGGLITVIVKTVWEITSDKSTMGADKEE